MKKVLLIILLIVAILSSVIAGTLAVYNSELDEIEGEVVAKAFVFEAAGVEDNYLGTIKIAPTENKSIPFSLQNYHGDNNSQPSEVAMKIKVKLKIISETTDENTGDLIYLPLDYSFELLTVDGNTVEQSIQLVDHECELAFYFPLAEVGIKRNLNIKCNWPGTDNDSYYERVVNKISVVASAIQETNIVPEIETNVVSLQHQKTVEIENNINEILIKKEFGEIDSFPEEYSILNGYINNTRLLDFYSTWYAENEGLEEISIDGVIYDVVPYFWIKEHYEEVVRNGVTKTVKQYEIKHILKAQILHKPISYPNSLRNWSAIYFAYFNNNTNSWKWVGYNNINHYTGRYKEFSIANYYRWSANGANNDYNDLIEKFNSSNFTELNEDGDIVNSYVRP